MLSNIQMLTLIALMMAGTLLTRVLPFWLFPAGRPTPPFVLYLGRMLPFASIGLLVVYCLKDVSLLSAPHGLPELLAIMLVAGLYLWRRNNLLAIAGGTLFYMFLVQAVFSG